ncbi:hypothetical protein GQ44DRAFT_736050 [Phaeosphaeriaceae sp. PMI808]|nr:hypothetical protein GQ44DRAFT_736050 [Phaeosphaeriaceae sp. PMI808]
MSGIEWVGPRGISRHSKWPRALRMHGSYRTWETIPLLIISVVVHPIITTVLGILIGFSLNLRSSTAYERYMEGHKVWSHLRYVSSTLARNVWIHAEERDGELGKEDLLAKLSFLNLIVAFAVALKHKVRFEPYIQYGDLNDLVSHLDTMARNAGQPSLKKEQSAFTKHIKTLLRIPGANPRQELKRAKRPVGNLPLEILGYMASFIKSVNDNGTLSLPAMESKALNNLQPFDGILVYVITLPIQLVKLMGWHTVPLCIISACIILGFAAIGNEIETPFGVELEEYAFHPDNKPLYLISSAGADFWPSANIEGIRDALKTKAMISKPAILWTPAISSQLEEHSVALQCSLKAHRYW